MYGQRVLEGVKLVDVVHLRHPKVALCVSYVLVALIVQIWRLELNLLVSSVCQVLIHFLGPLSAVWRRLALMSTRKGLETRLLVQLVGISLTLDRLAVKKVQLDSIRAKGLLFHSNAILGPTHL